MASECNDGMNRRVDIYPIVMTFMKRRLLPILETFNTEPIPELEQHWRNMGSRIPLPWSPTRSVKVKMIGGGLSMPQVLLECSGIDYMEHLLEKGLKQARGAWSYLKYPRNYYITSSYTLTSYYDETFGEMKMYWKVYFVVMPRKWRRRRYEARLGREWFKRNCPNIGDGWRMEN